ncbi:MAG: bacteriohemerythrin [Bryobacterales bacterium]|nr:bacteriohemerythrin [Bryobacterales bacterium]
MLEWKPEYNLGIASIDAQHRKLFDYVNTLEDAMRKGEGRQVLDKILSSVAAYTREHFGNEEQLMKRTGYAELLPHKAAHDAFAKQVQEFQRKHQAGEVGITVELVASLGDWVRNHVLGMDRKYAPHLRAHGIG